MSVFSLAMGLFLMANPIGTVPVFVSLTKQFDFHRQRVILFREAVLSMVLAYIFLFLGAPFLNVIHIEQYAVSISGGILVFLIALNMIFPHHGDTKEKAHMQEPFLVPIATPLISGGGVFALIAVYAKQEQDYAKMSLAIFLAWIAVIIVVVSSSYLKKILGNRGLLIMEQLMGMLLLMLAIHIMCNGAHYFIQQAV
jgi:multiple antibiotic resistance protein